MQFVKNEFFHGILIFYMLPGLFLATYITQEPSNLQLRAGESAKMSCTVQEHIEVEELRLSFFKNEIFSISVSDKTASKFDFSGTFKTFSWNVPQNNCSTHRSEDSLTLTCYSGDVTTTTATLWVKNSNDYQSRLDLSGSVYKLKVTLNDLQGDDMGTYRCSGKLKDVFEGFSGNETNLTVYTGLSNSAVVGIVVALVIGGIIIIIGGVWYYRHRNRRQPNPNPNIQETQGLKPGPELQPDTN
ncbi:uncharacterized protein [Hyperolius riggenbachi]|uniref:uncharacterized protein isoform X2 n=1 Tax=Hyperolius riggenbachi TaxID=752182 RepID=UPI0035A3856D